MCFLELNLKFSFKLSWNLILSSWVFLIQFICWKGFQVIRSSFLFSRYLQVNAGKDEDDGRESLKAFLKRQSCFKKANGAAVHFKLPLKMGGEGGGEPVLKGADSHESTLTCASPGVAELLSAGTLGAVKWPFHELTARWHLLVVGKLGGRNRNSCLLELHCYTWG